MTGYKRSGDLGKNQRRASTNPAPGYHHQCEYRWQIEAMANLLEVPFEMVSHLHMELAFPSVEEAAAFFDILKAHKWD